MMQHNLICNYLKIINITFATYIWQSYTSFYLIQSRIPLLWKQNSVFIRRYLVFSAFFCSFIFTLSSVLFIVQNDFDFTTWYECVKNTLTCTFIVAPTTELLYSYLTQSYQMIDYINCLTTPCSDKQLLLNLLQ